MQAFGEGLKIDNLIDHRSEYAMLQSNLGNALVDDGIIKCPYHGFRYDLSSGECLTAPDVAPQSHAERVIGSRVKVRLSQ